MTYVTPDPNKIKILDVSFYQEDVSTIQTIDFVLMKSRGIDGVIIRAGQNNWPDRDFQKNWRDARLAGLPRGSYWFYDSRESPTNQAKLWLKQLGNDFGEMVHWCDYEENYGGTYKGWKNFKSFIQELRRLAPNMRLGIYTGYWYWLANSPQLKEDFVELNFFKQFPLWIAAYNPVGPTVPKPWTTYELWQRTDNADGFYFGVESYKVDLDYYNGTREEWEKYTGMSSGSIYPTVEKLTLTLSNNEMVTLYRK